jgi:hypothetical protein
MTMVPYLLLSPFQIISRFDFFWYIYFAMRLDLLPRPVI